MKLENGTVTRLNLLKLVDKFHFEHLSFCPQSWVDSQGKVVSR